MAITNGYLTLDEAKAYLSIDDTIDDVKIELAVEAASRAIDDWCGRRFYQSDETRYYTASSRSRLWVDDLSSVTTLKTDPGGDGTYNVTWSASDYHLSPYNAATDGWPYTRIETSPSGSNTFPATPRGVEIVGTFGWPSVPDAVKKACVIQSNVFFLQSTEGAAPIVTMEGATLTSSRFLDRTAQLLLNTYRIPVVA